MIRFGPAGLGGVKDAVSNLEKYYNLGLKACEIAFTYSVYIKEEDAKIIGKKAKELDIQLSIHAPYFVNLNSSEKEKIEASKKRILDCCKVGEILGAKAVVFHAGFYGKMEREEGYQNIKNAVLDLMKEIKKNKWKIKLCPETMGKINVFGSPEEILRLVEDTGCSLCVDFAHLWARELGKKGYEELYAPFKKFDELHCHFSGIIFGDKGEKSHKDTSGEEIRKLLEVLPSSKKFTIINEAPNPIKDSLRMFEIFNKRG